MKIVLILAVITIGIAQPKYFDPDGYYFPVSNGEIGDLIIESFNISSLEYYVDGKLNYNNPKILKPEIHVLFSGDSTVTFAKNILLNKDTLSFDVELSGGKILFFNGIFKDKRGQYWNQNDIIPQQTILVSCVLRLVLKNNLIASRKMDFTYWEGD
jgi:hypothetical protein